MNPTEQRIAIAYACGWTTRRVVEGHTMWHHPDGTPIGCSLDYLHDLNAMAEAEKVLTDDQINDYGAYLKGRDNETVSLYCPEHREIAKVAMASAAQRAEAFLKAIGKWKDDK